MFNTLPKWKTFKKANSSYFNNSSQTSEFVLKLCTKLKNSSTLQNYKTTLDKFWKQLHFCMKTIFIIKTWSHQAFSLIWMITSDLENFNIVVTSTKRILFHKLCICRVIFHLRCFYQSTAIRKQMTSGLSESYFWIW